MDPLHFCIALGPLAAYLFALGIVNLSSRPTLVSGGKDAAALGLALSGFAVAGPMELFIPDTAAMRFGAFVWVLMLGLYWLVISFLVLIMRPRLVLYNIGPEATHSLLARLAGKLDPQAGWAGDSFFLPQLGVQLHLETFAPMRNTTLVASGPRQNYNGWKALQSALALELKTQTAPSARFGWSLLLSSLAIVALAAYRVFNNQQAVAQALSEMLGR
jgi:hypothetical protein